ncbi:MAG TPA: MoaD/ThiS family protein [Candidatus Bipolaricaulis anaerobius]|uniref:MoaD family protein n=1 Tax=Candidatus Bipolaricaulis anaerobius TaxID=2026885 RepID=A0A2X3K4V7_9BACT|nr:ubiquitin-like small modifier protein 1 [Candidatus Bipolaricaulis anaerobius]MBP7726505.1 MoaD/ThiS family protein [Candidatus Bipolaricaulis sp.]MDD2912592.1 MoaD/ThiS family protein [Candidatus Bipolaricaulis anaerobius]MDD5764086.1 MoaD/ThiS family protein [Candidatus Bipolaricaulis anaerobius]SQD92123.1 MoaD family protein [Candidatus Bipolaricaulis anaerobius]HNR24678.1 MoaD/ThiS family protein [Candidatus Bipolaricaulis anaerobius]
MKVTVKLFGEFRAAAGADQIELDLPRGATCGEALRTLAEREPSLGELLFAGDALHDHLHVFVNGRNVVHDQGLATPLSPGDVVTFFPPLSGG